MFAQVTETFAFIDLGSGDRGLADCIAGLNNTKWKGKVVRKAFQRSSSVLPSVSFCQMKLQQAKESFMERLARERRERESGGWTLFRFNNLVSFYIPVIGRFSASFLLG